ncbi:MAG: FkbM family methyltransferase [Verrucomicrobiae bacterium]|nr:FkbM family methyltransferase [Verrucomicrobiae bacterium]
MNLTTFFLKLIAANPVEVICDVGSMDGSQAKLFRRACPSARIVAFEANPRNFELMKQDPDFRTDRIELSPLAVSNKKGETVFFVDVKDYSGGQNRGTSSLFPGGGTAEEVTVGCTTLADLFAGELGRQTTFALWIDVEGAGIEVLEGAGTLLESVRLIHIEVESAPLRQGQRSQEAVHSFLTGKGFELLAEEQFPIRGDSKTFVANRVYVSAQARRDGLRGVGAARFWAQLVETLAIQSVLCRILPKRAYMACKSLYARWVAG